MTSLGRCPETSDHQRDRPRAARQIRMYEALNPGRQQQSNLSNNNVTGPPRCPHRRALTGAVKEVTGSPLLVQSDAIELSQYAVNI